MQGMIFTLVSWVHRGEAALTARVKDRPILTVTTCLAVVALPFLVFPCDVAAAIVGIPLLPVALVFAVESQGTEIGRELKRQKQIRKDRRLRDLQKKYGPGGRR